MKHFLLVTLFALGLQAQVVFNDFSPKVKGVTIGNVHCYFWSLVGPWDAEIACYADNVLQQLQVKSPGSFGSGYFVWKLTPTTFGGSILWMMESKNSMIYSQVSAQV